MLQAWRSKLIFYTIFFISVIMEKPYVASIAFGGLTKNGVVDARI